MGADDFRFDPKRHTYTDLRTGKVRPSVSKLLALGGLVNDAWMTEESALRGRAIHAATADIDLGVAVDPKAGERFRPYLLAWQAALERMRPEFEAVEEARMHPRYRYGCTTDRAGVVYGRLSVLEIKTGEPSKAHPVQTALQAILECDRWQLPPDMVARWLVYLKPSGAFELEEHIRLRDLDRAYKLIREHC